MNSEDERVAEENSPIIALTFDDGPSNNCASDRILDALEKYSVKATFFMVGEQVAKNPDNVMRKMNAGYEIGSHTWCHDYYGDKVTKDDILKGNEIIKQVIGKNPGCFRSPGGATNDFIRQVCKESGLPLFHWSVDTNDWRHRDAQKTYDEVVGHSVDGDIVLMHEIYDSTADAVEKILPALIERGFRFVTCSELVLLKTGKPPVPGMQYWKNGLICNNTK